MSDFRCEWQALHGPRCSHQCNECKDNDTPPELRMTSERLTKNGECPVCNTPIDASPAAAPRNEKSAADLMHAVQQTRAIKEKLEELHYTDKTTSGRDMLASALVGTRLIDYAASLEAVCVAAESLALRATPRAVPREHPSPEPYCASCDAREGEPCPHNVIQCARPRRAHPPRAVPASGEREDKELFWSDAANILCRVFDDFDAAMEEFRAWYDPTQWLHGYRALGAFIRQRLATPRAVPDETRERDVEVLIECLPTIPSKDDLREFAATVVRRAHPPRAGEVREEMVERALAYDASTWPSEKPWSEKAKADGRAYYRGLLTAALGRPS